MMRFLKDEDGQAVVEFAIIAPILLLILCGIIDFGWIFSAKLATDNCAREGARFASVCTDYKNAEYKTAQKVLEIASDNIKDNISVKVTYSNLSDPDSGDVTVTVTSAVKTLTFVANTVFGGSTVDISSSVTMKAQ